MDFDISFFKDEIRNGFYIPTALKQCFAAQLNVLSEIDKICKKHNIRYFADWGTLLAAVRHGGYIPWDDDLDIGMKRSDYIRFMEVAKSELPDYFDIHTYETKENHWLFITKILGTKHICFEPDYLNLNSNFPYIACVDIFLVDNLYKDLEKEKQRDKKILHILHVADSIVEGKISISAANNLLCEIESENGIIIDRSLDERHIGIALYKLVDTIMAEVPDDECGNVGQIFPWVLNGGAGYPKDYYDSLIELPFENITIPVPSSYNEALKLHYGEYLNVVKGAGAHTYPFFEAQKENLMKVAGFEFPEFRFKQEMLSGAKRNCGTSLESRITTLSSELNEMHAEICKITKLDDPNLNDIFLSTLASCQQNAIDIGTMIESIHGEGLECITKLENYCELLFTYSTSEVSNPADVAKSLDNALNDINLSLAKEILNRKSIVFITTSPAWWSSISPYYEEAENNKDTDVYVIPLPVFKKNAYGQIIFTEEINNTSKVNGANVVNNDNYDRSIINYELAGYPDNITLYDYTKIDLSLINPDTIYIQDLCDNENPCLTVPEYFYSANLKSFTDRLVYVLPKTVSDFSENDYCENYNLKHYLLKPGVFNVDQIIVSTATMRLRFMESLNTFTNNICPDRWEDIIVTDTNLITNKESIDSKKCVYYCIGENEICESSDPIKFIKRRLDIFKENEDKINTLIGFYPPDINSWKHNIINKSDDNHKISSTINEMMTLIDSYASSKSITILSELSKESLNQCSAYYGAPSPLVRDFIDSHKPVMIENLKM